jgi:uncharacterized peroxidase-related enzyme
LLGSDELPKALALDYASAELASSDRAMLDYAVKLTRTPQEIGGADIDRLRDAGFDDTAILDICQVASYYNYVNRMADGLGVELEDAWTPEDLVLTRVEFEARAGRR